MTVSVGKWFQSICCEVVIFQGVTSFFILRCCLWAGLCVKKRWHANANLYNLNVITVFQFFLLETVLIFPLRQSTKTTLITVNRSQELHALNIKERVCLLRHGWLTLGSRHARLKTNDLFALANNDLDNLHEQDSGIHLRWQTAQADKSKGDKEDSWPGLNGESYMLVTALLTSDMFPCWQYRQSKAGVRRDRRFWRSPTASIFHLHAEEDSQSHGKGMRAKVSLT